MFGKSKNSIKNVVSFPSLFLAYFQGVTYKGKTRLSPYMVVSDEVLKLDNEKVKKGAYRSVRDFITIKANILEHKGTKIMSEKNAIKPSVKKRLNSAYDFNR